jgi:hypothetical protein
MGNRMVRAVALFVVIIASLTILACDVGSLTGRLGSKPTVTIQSPASGGTYRSGDEVTIQSTAQDTSGVVRVELSVDGTTVRTDAPPVPQGQVSFTLVQPWQAVAGAHTLGVRAFNASGAASDPVFISVTVSAVSPTVEVVPTAVAQQGVGGTVAAGFASGTPTSAELTPTRRPPTRAPGTLTPTPAGPPGVYALGIRVDPAQPVRGIPPTFRVTFVNTTGKATSYRWYIKVYEPDKTNSKGETSKAANDFPAGTFELGSPADWAIHGPGPCEPFIARVYWYDKDANQTTEFLKPDLSGGPALAFQVCP